VSAILLGHAGRASVSLDLDAVLRTRLLVQGNSGAGKSWLLRRLAEQLFGKLPVLLVDPEGEFASLRERYGYVLVGKGGETPADTRSAALVAHKLLELRASAVCDLYEVKPSERHRWVRLFLEALVDAPKRLWHPTVVVVDEAHLFCPEKGTGESEALEAMVDLATRGRKRGLCPVFATQRLGKLRKDAAAELLNVLVGSTFIDVDRERAAEVLGIARADKPAFFDAIRLLESGHFWALGRAIATERVLIKIGPVTTTHPQPGSTKQAAEPPPPPERVRALLPKLADLPQQAEAKAKTEAELRAELRSLKAQLAQAKAAAPAPATTKPVEIEVVKPKTVKALERAVDRADTAIARANNVAVRLGEYVEAVRGQGTELVKVRDSLVGELRALRVGSARPPVVSVHPSSVKPETARVLGEVARAALRSVGRSGEPTAVMVSRATTGDDRAAPGLGRGGDYRMLVALAQVPEGMSDSRLALRTGITKRGGTFRTYLGKLKQAGYVAGDRGHLRITEAGVQAVGDFEPLPTGPALIDYWRRDLGESGMRAMFDAVVEAYPKALNRAELAERTGIAEAGGTFRTYLGKLKTLGLIEGRDDLRAAGELFV
jgi:ribosomal protein L29